MRIVLSCFYLIIFYFLIFIYNLTFAVYRKGDSREVKHHVYIKRQTRICTRWPTVPIICLYTVFFFYTWISGFTQFFIHKNCFELFLSAHFLLWEILNLNLTFAVCRILEDGKLSSISQLATAIYVPETKILKNLLFWNRINAAILKCTSGQELGSIERRKYQFTIFT